MELRHAARVAGPGDIRPELLGLLCSDPEFADSLAPAQLVCMERHLDGEAEALVKTLGLLIAPSVVIGCRGSERGRAPGGLVIGSSAYRNAEPPGNPVGAALEPSHRRTWAR